jgi:hypothetical protein
MRLAYIAAIPSEKIAVADQNSNAHVVQGPKFALRRHRALALFLVIIVLEIIVFRSYFVGRVAPPWDFFGPYNTEAYQWWELGGFFSPRAWVSNAWAGYPSALNLQNSGWYLPVGIASVVAPFTLHVSAIVSALHVALGSLGTYALVRTFKVSFPIALLATVASFFSVGHYSNAQHVDISRAYTWAPWLILVFAPTFPWRRFWSIPLASFVIWQAITGMYPGNTIAFVYVGLIWVITYQLISRVSFRDFLLPLAISGLIAVLLSMPRLLPYAMLHEDAAGTLAESSSISISMVGTLVFGYSSAEIGSDISMRSLFIPSTVLVLAFFASWRDRISKLAIALLVPAIVLGVPGWPWSDAAQSLPGLGLSRFGFSDFKVFMVLAIFLLACSGANSIFSLRTHAAIPHRMWASLGAAWVAAASFAVLGLLGPYTRMEWAPGLVLMFVSLAAVSSIFLTPVRNQKWAATVLCGLLILLTVVIGTNWAFTNDLPWRTDRISGETSTFGAPVDELISQRLQLEGLSQRPARVPMPEGADGATAQSSFSNRYSYLNRDSIVAYINLKGSETQSLLEEFLVGSQASKGFADFLTAPGTAITVGRGEALTTSHFEECSERQSCGAATIVPVSYSPGHFEYEVTNPTPVDAVFNEAYYQGWTARSCVDGVCEELEPARSAQGLVSIEMPSGHYLLRLDYSVRGAALGWLLFWLGVGGSTVACIWVALRGAVGRKFASW